MSSVDRQFYSLTQSGAALGVPYNDTDDALSLRRYLFRAMAPVAWSTAAEPTGDEPYFFIEPLEAKFRRPAVTIRLLPGGISENTQSLAGSNYAVEHQVVMMAYGMTRQKTIELGELLARVLLEGGPTGAPMRVPLWAFSMNVRLARMMRVLPNSLSMGLEERNEGDIWSRPIELRLQSPRTRPVGKVPMIHSVEATPVGG